MPHKSSARQSRQDHVTKQDQPEPDSNLPLRKRSRQLSELEVHGLRRLAGLFENQSLETGVPLCSRQADAVASMEQLLTTGKYDAHQLNVFSKEIADGGKRRYCVHTFAGFVLENAPSRHC